MQFHIPPRTTISADSSSTTASVVLQYEMKWDRTYSPGTQQSNGINVKWKRAKLVLAPAGAELAVAA